MHAVQVDRIAQRVMVHFAPDMIDELQRFQRKRLVEYFALISDP